MAFGQASPFVKALVSGQVKQAQYNQAPNTVVQQTIKPAPVNVTTTKQNSSPAPRPSGSTTQGGGGGGGVTQSGGGGGGSTYVAPDPYAAWGGKAHYDQLVSDYGSAKNTAFGSIGDRENDSQRQYHSSILDYLDSLKAGQTNIDNDVVNNELAKNQGSSQILDMVSHGVRSAGVRLAAGNAGSSSAAEQLARAWGENGKQQLSTVENQYELGKNNIGNEQGQFDTANGTTRRHLEENKSTVVNDIINDATQKLSDLNYRASTANLPDRIDIENEKNRIRNEAMGKLQAFDGELAQGQGNVHQINPDDARAKASQLAVAGKAAPNPFSFQTVLPVNGPAPTEVSAPLPTYAVPNKKDNQ